MGKETENCSRRNPYHESIQETQTMDARNKNFFNSNRSKIKKISISFRSKTKRNEVVSDETKSRNNRPIITIVNKICIEKMQVSSLYRELVVP